MSLPVIWNGRPRVTLENMTAVFKSKIYGGVHR